MISSPTATYKQAGVDVSAAGNFIQAIQPLAGLTRRPGLLKGIGGFGGLFELNCLRYKDPVLVASADGVGTKVKIAQKVGFYSSLGIDLVAMNVNDILCAGAEPIFFLDYIATGKLEPRVMLEVVKGVVRGCIESNCVLLGGETAQMGLMYKAGDFDLAGFTVGIVEKKRIVTGETIKPGDKLIGLQSNGIHANGYTLVQKVLSATEQKKNAEELLKPTRIYVRPVLGLLKGKAPVMGIAHITGGSFEDKLVRILPHGTTAVLRKRSWPVLPVFKRLQAAGIDEAEMYGTFNMGVGMVLAVPASGVAAVRARLRKEGLPNWVVGEVEKGNREVVLS